jgi:PPM family protein phosphatase
MRVQLAWATDPGLRRDENEDSVLVWQDRGGVEALLVVCDGMGGHAAGHLASSLATETFALTLQEDGGQGPDLDRLLAASARANAAVHEASVSNPAWSGMGSTIVVAAIGGNQLGVINVGDSPAYLVRDGSARLISQDHSWPAEQVRLGVISAEEARDHPLKHRLTRAIGVWDSVPAYSERLDLRSGDLVVVCSDGVEAAGVSVDEMCEMLRSGDLQAGVDRVIEACRQRGAPDNVSVALARIQEAERKTVTLQVDRVKRRVAQA